MEHNMRRSPIAVTAGILSFLLFAGQFIVSRHGVVQGLTPYDITALRYAVAGLIATPVVISWGLADLGGLGWIRGLVLTLVSGVPYFLLMIAGLSYAQAAHAVVLNPGMTLIGGLLISALWLGERPTRIDLLASFIGLLGLAVIGWTSFSDLSEDTWVGDSLFLVTGLAWAIYMVLLARWRVSPIKATLVVAFMSLVYLPLYGATAMGDNIVESTTTSDILLQAVYQGIVHSLIAMALFAFAVQKLGSGRVALMTPIVPAAGIIMAVVLLDERPGELQWLGAGLVCTGIGLTTFRRAN